MLTGVRYTRSVDKLVNAVLAEWERRWPDQKWRETFTEEGKPGKVVAGAAPVVEKPIRRAAVDAVLDTMERR